MRSIKDGLEKYFKGDFKKPTSERSYLIQNICDDLFSNKDFIKLLGQTKLLTLNEIGEIYTKSKNWETNPQALFWKLLKEKNEEIKKELKKDSEKKL